MLTNPAREFRNNVLRIVLRIGVHGAIAVVGSMILGGLILQLSHIRAYGPHYFTILLLTDVPYSPAFWGTALITGFFRFRQTKDELAVWLGPLALALFGLLILVSIPGYFHSPYELARSNHSFIKYLWGELFGIDPNPCGGDECLGKVMFTAPALNCTAYSVGAWLAMRLGKREGAPA